MAEKDKDDEIKVETDVPYTESAKEIIVPAGFKSDAVNFGDSKRKVRGEELKKKRPQGTAKNPNRRRFGKTQR